MRLTCAVGYPMAFARQYAYCSKRLGALGLLIRPMSHEFGFTARSFWRGVLGLAVAKGPVFLGYLDKADHDILGSNAGFGG